MKIYLRIYSNIKSSTVTFCFLFNIFPPCEEKDVKEILTVKLICFFNKNPLFIIHLIWITRFLLITLKYYFSSVSRISFHFISTFNFNLGNSQFLELYTLNFTSVFHCCKFFASRIKSELILFDVIKSCITDIWFDYLARNFEGMHIIYEM